MVLVLEFFLCYFNNIFLIFLYHFLNNKYFVHILLILLCLFHSKGFYYTFYSKQKKHFLYLAKIRVFHSNQKSVKQQISGTTIQTKFAPPYACIFMNQVESEFLKTQQHQPLVWFRYIDDIFFIWTHGQEKLEGFLDNFNKFHPNLRFTHEYSRKHVTFLDLDVKIIDQKIFSNLHIKATDRHQYLHYTLSHPYHTKR